MRRRVAWDGEPEARRHAEPPDGQHAAFGRDPLEVERGVMEVLQEATVAVGRSDRPRAWTGWDSNVPGVVSRPDSLEANIATFAMPSAAGRWPGREDNGWMLRTRFPEVSSCTNMECADGTAVTSPAMRLGVDTRVGRSFAQHVVDTGDGRVGGLGACPTDLRTSVGVTTGATPVARAADGASLENHWTGRWAGCGRRW